jgi:hypothetical protein
MCSRIRTLMSVVVVYLVVTMLAAAANGVRESSLSSLRGAVVCNAEGLHDVTCEPSGTPGAGPCQASVRRCQNAVHESDYCLPFQGSNVCYTGNPPPCAPTNHDIVSTLCDPT